MILTTRSHRIHHCTFLLARVFFSSVRIQNRLSRKPIFLMRLPCRPKHMKQITRGPLRMDAQVLGSIGVYIYLTVLAFCSFCVPETFHRKFPVLVKSVFKIVTRALPLRPTPNYPSTSKLRDRRRICLFFMGKGELRGRARRESVCLVSVKLPIKLTGDTTTRQKTSDTPGRFFSFHFLFFIELESFVPF